jgi:hypothetical protein
VTLIRRLLGNGHVRAAHGPDSEVHYDIAIWDAGGAVFGRGQVTGNVEAIGKASSARGPIPLVLSDGKTVGVICLEQSDDNDWAEIFVPRPPVELIPAAWPAFGQPVAAVFTASG